MSRRDVRWSVLSALLLGFCISACARGTVIASKVTVSGHEVDIPITSGTAHFGPCCYLLIYSKEAVRCYAAGSALACMGDLAISAVVSSPECTMTRKVTGISYPDNFFLELDGEGSDGCRTSGMLTGIKLTAARPFEIDSLEWWDHCQ